MGSCESCAPRPFIPPNTEPKRPFDIGMLKRRLKLLFLARPFPPLGATACVRTWNLAKYLARSDWDVTVVTPRPSVWRYVDNPERVTAEIEREGVRRILTDHRWRCLSPASFNCWNQGLGWLVGGVCRKVAQRFGIDNGIGWIRAAERACSMLSPKDVDIILATGSPFAAFQLARRLSDRLGCRYVLDYRDPWTGNPHVNRLVSASNYREEARLLKDCAAVTITSPSWASALDKRFRLGSKLHVITNGYDPEEMASVKPYRFGHFAIVYAGNFYPPKRVVSPVMAALKRVKQFGNGKTEEWYFHYYGEHADHVRTEAQRFAVLDRVIVHGRVSRSEALSAVRGGDIAVVLTSILDEATIEERGIMTGKVFEALGLGTTVLSVAPRGSDVNSVADTAGSVHTFTGSNVDGIASFITGMMRGLQNEPRNRESYAWPNIIKKLDGTLREAAEHASKEQTRRGA